VGVSHANARFNGPSASSPREAIGESVDAKEESFSNTKCRMRGDETTTYTDIAMMLGMVRGKPVNEMVAVPLALTQERKAGWLPMALKASYWAYLASASLPHHYPLQSGPHPPRQRRWRERWSLSGIRQFYPPSLSLPDMRVGYAKRRCTLRTLSYGQLQSLSSTS
jgi:hypothetical protein